MPVIFIIVWWRLLPTLQTSTKAIHENEYKLFWARDVIFTFNVFAEKWHSCTPMKVKNAS